eukprot:759523-Hanusia_phi.AAC.6
MHHRWFPQGPYVSSGRGPAYPALGGVSFLAGASRVQRVLKRGSGWGSQQIRGRLEESYLHRMAVGWDGRAALFAEGHSTQAQFQLFQVEMFHT